MGCPPRRRHRRPVARGPGRSAAGGLNGSTRRLRTRFGTGSGGEDLIEDRLGIGLIGLLGQRQLGDQNLPRLGEHPLLPGREATVLVAAPQIAHDLGGSPLIERLLTTLRGPGLPPALVVAAPEPARQLRSALPGLEVVSAVGGRPGALRAALDATDEPVLLVHDAERALDRKSVV